MSERQGPEGFDPSVHEAEARRRWGKTESWKESQRRTRQYTEKDWIRLKAESAAIMEDMASALTRGLGPGDEAARGVAERHRLHIDRWFYPCTHRAHAGLADLYVGDPRFRATFDRHAAGLAEYFAGAVRANARGDR